jgi:exopolyphosphatase / guanosine-5'-triphosphate,3'-diphosphate pyrophosphatase
MAIISTLDLGTNSCLLLIVRSDLYDISSYEVLYDVSTVVRTGEGVDRTHEFSHEAMERTRACLINYAEKVRFFGADPQKTICVATSQARDARNAQMFFDRIEQETGFKITIITGDQESYYTFKGALLPGMHEQKTIVLDVGGGSTELVSIRGGQSIDMGAVRFTERFFKNDPITQEEFLACQHEIDRLIEQSTWFLVCKERNTLCGVAGNITTLAAWLIGLKQFDADRVNGTRLSRERIYEAIIKLKQYTQAERQMIIGGQPGRADIVLAGSVIIWRVMELLHFDDIIVSTRGLRYGILISV